MVKRLAILGAGVLLAAGGWAAAGKWRDGRIAECEQRAARLSALAELSRGPEGFQPDSPAAGCDLDRVVAYAARQFVAAGGPSAAREPDISAFYRQLLRGGEWQISDRAAAPGLCASKELPLGRAYLDLSFPFAGAYEVTVADTPCA